MKILVRLFCSTVVATTFPPVFGAFADDEQDFRTMEVPNEVYVCESLEQLKRLKLTGEQREEEQVTESKEMASSRPTPVDNHRYIFAGRVTPPPRKTRFRPLVKRYRTGFPPAGFQRKVSKLFNYISFPFPKLDVAQSQQPILNV